MSNRGQEILEQMQAENEARKAFNRKSREELVGFVGEDLTNSLSSIKRMQDIFELFLQDKPGSPQDIVYIQSMVEREAKCLVESLGELAESTGDLNEHRGRFNDEGELND